jgi:CheY-like chemotaxis protein
LTFVNGVIDYLRQRNRPKAVKLAAYSTTVEQIRTVLLVDDEPVDRFIAEQVILRTGRSEWRIVSFPSALKALNFISFTLAHGGTFPDVILTDLQMPHMDGFEFLETLKQHYAMQLKTSRVIALTISEDRTRWQKATATGASEVLVKPLTSEKWLRVRYKNDLGF